MLAGKIEQELWKLCHYVINTVGRCGEWSVDCILGGKAWKGRGEAIRSSLLEDGKWNEE